MYEKKVILRGGGVFLIYYFSTDKISGTGYEIHLLCAIIADHVIPLAIYFSLISGRQDAFKKVVILQTK